jgi:Thermolysin metallopeptidase, alpha-helical domain/Fungalysin/Thermolysin Propeptide Motif
MRRTALVTALALATALSSALPASPAGTSEGLRLRATLRSMTGTHEWYEQTFQGYPVLGAYYAKHLDLQGNVVEVADGRLRVQGRLRQARLTAAQARARTGSARAAAELVVFAGTSARLVWAVYSPGGIRTLVDAAEGRILRRESVVVRATGEGRVFDPNPVTTLRDESLTDQKDQDYAALQPAYFVRTLTRLDGSGFLRGDFADIKGTTSSAFSADLRFLFGRSDDRFEQTMAYYNVTTTQEYIQSLGFTDINNEPQDVKVDQFGGDNSFFYPKQDFIKVGKGGVDDAEDAEVTWHEYGHAIQDSQVPGFGVGHDGGSIGEGFSDYWAVTMSVPVSGGYEVPCVANWDSISYTDEVPHCLRRTDLDLTVDDQNGGIHHDGQIWSRALWDIHNALGRRTADTIILEAQFSFAPDTSFRDAALDTVAAARALFGRTAARTVERAFRDRGIL